VATAQPKVGILMGSDSDLEVMREAEKRLDAFGIAYETRIMSAHRTPERAAEYAASAEQRGLQAIICGAGAAAHLAGAIAANTTLAGDRHSDRFVESQRTRRFARDRANASGNTGGHHGHRQGGSRQRGHFCRADRRAQRSPAWPPKLAQFKKEMAAGVEERDRKLQSERIQELSRLPLPSPRLNAATSSCFPAKRSTVSAPMRSRAPQSRRFFNSKAATRAIPFPSSSPIARCF
jgi:5-(carboxyamino)imidazole ribonucleotide mutase